MFGSTAVNIMNPDPDQLRDRFTSWNGFRDVFLLLCATWIREDYECVEAQLNPLLLSPTRRATHLSVLLSISVLNVIEAVDHIKGLYTHFSTSQDVPVHSATRRSSIFSFSSSSSHEEPPVANRIVHQFVPVSRPSRPSCDLERDLAFDAINYRQTLRLKALLLSPWPADVAPFVRQPVNIYSYGGSVEVEVQRVFGADNHHFVLDVNAPKAQSVCITVPSSFHGEVCLSGSSKTKRLQASKGFSKRVKGGYVRLVKGLTAEDENEDSLLISTKGDVLVRLTGETTHRGISRLTFLNCLSRRLWN